MKSQLSRNFIRSTISCLLTELFVSWHELRDLAVSSVIRAGTSGLGLDI
jgi:hypothetical protein